ncbi:hypothetical protein L9G16_11695 [Shewanella sp. A25]|nr:hypothetical protein [Shewanella shenzhenensis]
MPTIVLAAGARADRGGHPGHHNGQNHHGQNHHKHHHGHYAYRPYYPWGLGLGLSLATGWGWTNGFYGNGWYGNGWYNGGSVYWNGPYSGIGISIPLRSNEAEVYRSAPTQVTTSMHYSAQAQGEQEAGRMGPSLVDNSEMAVNSSRQIDSSNMIENAAITTVSAIPRSYSSLPSNAKIVQRDGRTLYEWQGVLYAFDWNSQTYQEQFAK